MMIRLFSIFCFAGLATKVVAQQRPHYTQYILNNYIINPAVAGIEQYVDVKASHRHQWVGIQDAPVTTYFTIHGSIGKDDYRENPSSFTPEGGNPRGKAYWQDYAAPKPHHGWGATIVNDRTGPLNRFSMYGTYAYHLGIGPRTTLSAGISAGFTRNGLDADKLIFDNPIDPAVSGSGIINTLRPDVNLGLWLYSANYFVGLSALQIIPQGLEFSNSTLQVAQKSYPHLLFTAGYKFYAGEDVSIIPSAVVRYVNPLPLGIDVNVKAMYRDRVWLGASYRHNDGVAGMLGVNVSNTFNIGYAYDYSTSKLQNFTRGTHEIVVGFMIGNRWGDMCPRNLW
jgi:type IX secretion system PorP/SprF family membrane protein